MRDMEDNNIDELFKQAASNEKGAFNPSFFDEMNAMMIADGKSKRKKRLFFYFLNGLVLLIGVGAIGYYLNLNEGDATSKSSSIANASVDQNNDQLNASFVSSRSSSEEQQNVTKLAENKEDINSSSSISSSKTNATTSNLSSPNFIQNSKSKLLSNIGSESNEFEQNNNDAGKSIGQAKPNDNNEQPNIKKPEINSEKKIDEEFNAFNEGNNDNKKDDFEKEKKNDTKPPVLNNNKEVSNSTGIKSTKSINRIDKLNPKTIEIDFVSNEPYPFFEIPQEDLDSIERMLPKTSILLGLNNHKGFDSWGHSPMIGLNYSHPIKSNFALEFSLYGYYLDNLVKDSTYNVEYYDVGFTKQQTNIDVQRLFVVEIPVGVSYSINDKLSLKMNGIYSRLVNSKTVIESDITNYRKQITNQKTKSESYGLFLGVNRNDFAFSTGVEYKFSKNWSALVDGYFGAQNISKDPNYNSNIRSIRLMIKYRLF